jgi:hypothetical protein
MIDGSIAFSSVVLMVGGDSGVNCSPHGQSVKERKKKGPGSHNPLQ